MNSTDADRLEGDVDFLSHYWNTRPPETDALALSHFGLTGQSGSDGFLRALDMLRARRPDAVRQLLLTLCEDEHLLRPLDRIAQYLYKVLTGLPLSRSIGICLDMVDRVIRRHPLHPHGGHMVLEFLIYFGLLDQAEQFLAHLPAQQHLEHRAMLRRARSRLAHFVPRHRFSFCILTWNRADLLDRCLADLKAKAASDDYEIIVGVNASTDHTAEVLTRHGISQVHWNARNDSIDYYREIMDAAKGEILVEIDDNVVEFPPGFDHMLAGHLEAFPHYGYIGLEPTRLSLASGSTQSMHLDGAGYVEERSGDLRLWRGPVWGCCAALRNRDYRRINGLYGARLSKTVGEEPQFIRKLYLHGMQSGLIRGPRLIKAFP